MRWFWTLLGTASLVVFGFSISASAEPISSNPAYTQGRVTLQVLSGALFSSSAVGPTIPDFDTWRTDVRLGWMLTSPGEVAGALSGSWEGLLELSNAVVFEGFGDYVGGLGALIRYNVTGLHPRWVPYAQAGLAVVVTDAYKDETQTALGQAVNLAPRLATGFRWLLGERWSLDAEAAYEHISNAGMDERNDGVNAFGGFVGVTYFFGDF